MKKQLLYSLIILSGLTIFFIACNKDEVEDYIPKEYIGNDASYLRIINTISIPRRVDFYVNDQKMNGDSIAYPSTFPAAEFLRIPSGSATFKATVPATNTNIFTSTFTFSAGKYNTLWVIDTLPTIDAYQVTDDKLIPPPDSGKAAIRFVHVAKGVGNLNLANTTVATAVDTVIKNISYKSHSPFIIVNSGSSLKFQLYLSGTTTVFATALTQSLTPNRMYTFYIRGRAGVTGTYAPALVAIVTR